MGDPPVSVCVPTFNGSPFIRECLDAVLAQTFDDIEVLVVDDASTDDTAKIVASMATTDARIRLVRNPTNLGLVANWNRAVSIARGRWVKFVFQDDRIQPTCVARLVEAGDDAPIVACRRSYVFEGVDDEVRREYIRPARINIDSLFPGVARVSPNALAGAALDFFGLNIIGEPTSILFQRDLVKQVGPFNEALIALCDFEFWLRAAQVRGLAWVPEPLVTFRVHGGAASAGNRARHFRRNHGDHIILWHEVATHPAHHVIRRVASERRPPIDPLAQAAALARRTRIQAELFAINRHRPDRTPLEDWRSAVAACPAVARVPSVANLDRPLPRAAALTAYRARFYLTRRRRLARQRQERDRDDPWLALADRYQSEAAS